MGIGTYLEIANGGATAVSFSLSVNGRSFLSSDADVIAEVKAGEIYATSGLAYATWRWLQEASTNWFPYTGEHWINAPALYANSLGFGFCDDVAGVFARLMESAGYDARIWGLSGHVVPEVLIDGRWQLFDPDLGALYFDSTGRIASYEDVSATDPAMLRANAAAHAGSHDLVGLDWSYSDLVLGLYRTTDDNVAYEPEPVRTLPDATFDLPPGATLRLESADGEVLSMTGEPVTELNRLTIAFGAVTQFDFGLPLIVEAIEGAGTAWIDGMAYAIGGEALNARLADRSAPVFSLILSTEGPANSVSYLVSARRFSLDSAIDVDISSPLSLTLVGEDGPRRLKGDLAGDTLIQRAARPNEAAGSVLDGGAGDDVLTLDGAQAYTSNYVSMLGGAGDDLIRLGVGARQYVGSVKVEAGAGRDVIEIGHVEGSTRGAGYVDGGAGDDVIRSAGDWAAYNGIWGNSKFGLLGGAGDDLFVLGGTQVNVAGGANGAYLSGGAGFDTLHWNGRYNLTIGGAQNPALGRVGSYAQELRVSDIERVDLGATGVSGLDLVFTPDDVAAITAGSDFDRAELGFGLSGTGHVLFVAAGANMVALADFVPLGVATFRGSDYYLHVSGGEVLGLLI